MYWVLQLNHKILWTYLKSVTANWIHRMRVYMLHTMSYLSGRPQIINKRPNEDSRKVTISILIFSRTLNTNQSVLFNMSFKANSSSTVGSESTVILTVGNSSATSLDNYIRFRVTVTSPVNNVCVVFNILASVIWVVSCLIYSSPLQVIHLSL